MLIRRFKIGKKKQYKGFSICIGWFKFERIGQGRKFMWRFEISNWGD